MARGIKAERIRANTVYANKIKAARVYGHVVRVGKMAHDDWCGELQRWEVVAPVICAHEIKADTIIAGTIHATTSKSGSPIPAAPICS